MRENFDFWQSQSTTFYAPATTIGVFFRVYAAWTGTIYIDDIRIE